MPIDHIPRGLVTATYDIEGTQKVQLFGSFHDLASTIKKLRDDDRQPVIVRIETAEAEPREVQIEVLEVAIADL